MITKIVLGIDAASERSEVAVASGQNLLSFRRSESAYSAESMLALINQCLLEAAVEGSSLDRINVSVGPGSFTGIRTGIATAQGLSAAWKVPVLGVSSLLARSVSAVQSDGVYLAHLKAHSTERYFSVYQRSQQGRNWQVIEALARVEQAELSSLAEQCSAQLLEVEKIDVSPAQALACIDIEIEQQQEQFQTTQSGIGLKPLYGKEVSAKTLAQRGISLGMPAEGA